MQGLHDFIPTEVKIQYLNLLLKAGFDVLDFGSFVSPKAIPQLADTAEVLKGLELSGTQTKLLAIVANKRGAEDALKHSEIAYLGYPFSISETFQMRNTNTDIQGSVERVAEIVELCAKAEKTPLIYISMAFGNPYGDKWSAEIAASWAEMLHIQHGINHIALADTTGVSNPTNISELFSTLIPAFPNCTFGAHLHTTPDTWKEKIESAWNAGCRHFDGAIKGFGGCPMAADALTGNMPTELMYSYFEEIKAHSQVKSTIFAECVRMAGSIFPIH
jgi:hydroxymethylglutaryl-CoA lyase